jgi:hypothetical protein
MAHDDRSLEEIRRDTERARAGLTETVGQLRVTVTETADDFRHRISPDTIKAEVRGYIKSRGEEISDTVRDTIRNNPVQAVAVGATLAYPLWKLVRAIPAPVLLVGAGLYLAGSKSGKQITQRASDAARDLANEAEHRARAFGANAADAAVAAQQIASGTLQAAGDAVSSRATQFRQAAAHSAAELKHQGEEFGRTMSSGADDLRRRANAAGEAFATQAEDAAERGAGMASGVAESIRDTAASVRDTVADKVATARDSAGEAASRLRSRIGDTADASLEAAARMRDRAAQFSDRAGRNVVDTVSAHPLLVAGIGLVVGGLIASAIPRLRFEDQTIGRAGRRLREQASDVVARGADAVREKGRAAYDAAARAAEDEGLTSDKVANAVDEFGERARKVAEAAAASFDAPSQNKH